MEFLKFVNKETEFDMVCPEYPGYSLRKKENICTLQMQKESLQIYKFLLQEYKDHTNIVVLGRSIGSGPAIFMASRC